MTPLCLIFVVCTAFADQPAAADVAGTWRATFLAPREEWPRFFSEITFDLAITGDQVRGTAHLGNWPGKAPILEGRLKGNEISFTAIGQHAWTMRSPSVSKSGYPRLEFTGVVNGDQMELTFTWRSVLVMFNGKPIAPTLDPDPPQIFKMQGTRLSR
jgi:hypothetical protein